MESGVIEETPLRDHVEALDYSHPPKPGWEPRYLLTRNKDNGTSELKPIYILQGNQNFKVSLTIGLEGKPMRTSAAVIDTGAGPSVIRSDMLPEDWKSTGIIVPKSETRRIQDASGNIVNTKATVQLAFVLGPLSATFQFLVVDTLAVPILLGCDFINQYVKCIKPREGRIELQGGGMTFLIRNDIKKNSITDTTIRIAKYIELPPMSETNVLVQTSAEGLCTLYSVNQNNIRNKKEYAMANGFAELQKLKPFLVRVLNFSSNPKSIQKHAVIGFAHATSSEDQLFTIPTHTDKEEI